MRGAANFGDGHDLALLRFPLGDITGRTGTNAPPSFAGDQSLGLDPVQVGSPFDRSVYAAGTEVFVVGRGFNTPTAETSTLALRDLHTVLRSDGDMDDFYNHTLGLDYWQNTLMIGAGFTNKTICHGDSGGPLTVNRNGRIIQVGVASFTDTSGTHCDAPGAFMELDGPQLAWIASVVPSIMAGWGPCTTSTGEPGDPYALYGNYSGGPSTSARMASTDGRWAARGRYHPLRRTTRPVRSTACACANRGCARTSDPIEAAT